MQVGDKVSKQTPDRNEGKGMQMGSPCPHCGEWIDIGLLSAVKHFEKSERCMVRTISDGLKTPDPPMMGRKMKEAFDKFINQFVEK